MPSAMSVVYPFYLNPMVETRTLKNGLASRITTKVHQFLVHTQWQVLQTELVGPHELILAAPCRFAVSARMTLDLLFQPHKHNKTCLQKVHTSEPCHNSGTATLHRLPALALLMHGHAEKSTFELLR